MKKKHKIYLSHHISFNILHYIVLHQTTQNDSIYIKEWHILMHEYHKNHYPIK